MSAADGVIASGEFLALLETSTYGPIDLAAVQHAVELATDGIELLNSPSAESYVIPDGSSFYLVLRSPARIANASFPYVDMAGKRLGYKDDSPEHWAESAVWEAIFREISLVVFPVGLAR